MTIDIHSAKSFLAAHGRVLDRRRFDLLTGDGDPAAVLDAVDAYRNPDGGYGWGLEPDLRDVTSQPGGALHAFEAIADAAPARSRHAVALCDWLDTVSLPDGGLPFALPVSDPAASAPFWTGADGTTSSLQITAAVVAAALRVAAHDPAVAGHPWLDRATAYCLEATPRPGQAIELRFALQCLDALADSRPEAVARIERLGAAVPPDGIMPVAGGLADEAMRPLDVAPFPDRPVRRLYRQDAVDAELDRLESRQTGDGGWPSEFASYSPAAELEWRGYLTVHAVSVLRANGRVSPSA